MCLGVTLPIDELPEALLQKQQHRIILRGPGVSREVRFLYRDPRPELPAWHDCQFSIYPWGNRLPSCRLPPTGWCRREDLDAGLWQHLHPVAVEIPATLGLEKGVWFLVPEGGLRGVLVRDEHGQPHIYLLTQPASHYYQIMTRSPRMPVFLGRQM